jgi:hypothetical protein
LQSYHKIFGNVQPNITKDANNTKDKNDKAANTMKIE